MLALLGSWAAVSFLYGLELVLLALVATERLGIGENGLALLYTAFGVGSMVAIRLASRTADRARQGVALAVATMVPGLALAGLAFTTSPAVGAVLAAIDGAAALVLDVLVITSLQRLLGNELMGRAYAASDALVIGALLLGTVAGAPLVDAVGLEAALLVGGSVTVAAGLVLLARAGSLDRRAAERALLLADRVALLAPLDLFAGASRATLEALASRSTTEPLQPGSDAVRQGDEPDDLFVVVAGTLVVTVAGEGVVRTLGSGEAFGEIGLLRRVPAHGHGHGDEPVHAAADPRGGLPAPRRAKGSAARRARSGRCLGCCPGRLPSLPPGGSGLLRRCGYRPAFSASAVSPAWNTLVPMNSTRSAPSWPSAGSNSAVHWTNARLPSVTGVTLQRAT